MNARLDVLEELYVDGRCCPTVDHPFRRLRTSR
jgi:hypothetical protein